MPPPGSAVHEIEKKEVKRVVLSPLEKELRRRRNSQHFHFLFTSSDAGLVSGKCMEERWGGQLRRPGIET